MKIRLLDKYLSRQRVVFCTYTISCYNNRIEIESGFYEKIKECDSDGHTDEVECKLMSSEQYEFIKTKQADWLEGGYIFV